jgi:hypothetical protein
VPDVRVRDRREPADERGPEKDETERDRVEVAQLPSARREDEHHERGDYEDEGEDIDRSTPQIRTVSVLSVLELVHVCLGVLARHRSVGLGDLDECATHLSSRLQVAPQSDCGLCGYPSTMDLSLLPEDLRHLAPLIERYAESDDVERGALLDRASDDELSELSAAPATDWPAINAFLDEHVAGPPGPLQDVALALDSFSQAALEARFALDARRA